MSKNKFSVIGINNFKFGVMLEYVQEVTNIPRITPIPNSPEYYAGVYNLRGNVYSLVDLGILLGIGKTSLSTESMMVQVTNNHYSVGLKVSQVHTIIEAEIKEKEENLAPLGLELKRFVKGVIQDAKMENVLILDVLRLLSSPELTIYF